MIKVLIQYNSIPHYRKRIFQLLSEYKDISFQIFADNESEFPYLRTIKSEEPRGINYKRVKTHYWKIGPLPELHWQPDTIKHVWKERPSAVIALGIPYSLTSWALLIIGRILKIPVLLWGQGLNFEERGFKWQMRKFFYRLAWGHLLYGDWAKEILIKRGFDPRRLYVVYNSLDYDLQKEISASIKKEELEAWRESLGINRDERIVIYSGRLQPSKHLHLIVEAAHSLSQAVEKIHVVFIGRGSDEKKLKAMASSYGMEAYVHFLGEQYDERYLGVAFGSSDLCIMPMQPGLTVIHALSFGTPVLLCDNSAGYYPEGEAVTEDVNGFYYRAGDANDMAAKMNRALFPVSCKKRMQNACREIVDRCFNPHYQLTVFSKAIEDAVTKKN